jgi:hypothetical protein
MHEPDCECEYCSTLRVVYALMVAERYGFITEKDKDRAESILALFCDNPAE